MYKSIYAMLMFFVLLPINNSVFADTKGSIVGYPSTSLDNLTLMVTIDPIEAEQGKPGSLFVAAQLPNKTWYYPTETGWQVWHPATPLPPYQSTILKASNSIIAFGNLDVTFHEGTTIYAGYGSDSQAMLAHGTYSPVYIVPSVDSVAELGGMVANFGLTEENPTLVSSIIDVIHEGLKKRGIPSVLLTSSVLCPAKGGSVACYDARFFIPHMTESNENILKYLMTDGPVEDIVNSSEKVSFIRSRGVQKGNSVATLFAFREALKSSIMKASDDNAAARTKVLDDGAVLGTSIRDSRSAPASTDVWEGYSVQTIEGATVNALNSLFAELVDEPLTFDLVSDCPSTISTLEFCSYLDASATYDENDSTTTAACTDTCEATYETCKGLVDACNDACFWGGCDCGMGCGSAQTSCDDGCDAILTGSAEIKIESATGLQKTLFTSASIPSLSSSTSISETVSVELSPGLTAQVYWKLCQSGICADGTDPMSSSTVALTATTTVTSEACTEGGNALYMTITALDITEYGLWGIPAFVDEVTGDIDSDLDWLADNISDLFSDDLQAPYEALLTDTTNELMSALNTLLKTTPIIACPTS